MIRKTMRSARQPVAAVFLLLGTGTYIQAQTAPAAAPVAGTPATEEDVVVLSPFVVSGSEDTGYRATSTLAATRIRTELKDVGSALSVVTEQLLKDTGSRNSEDLLAYTTNAEVGGTTGNYVGQSISGSANQSGLNLQDSLLRPNTNTRVRGLDEADNCRDFFLTDIPWDSYNTGRVDLQRGPNAVLFGLGKSGGIVNASINSAAFKDTNTLETRYGSYGSFRASLDVNKVLLENELAVRLDLLHDKQYFQQKPAYSRDQRVYGALRYDPAFLNKGSAHTSLRLNYEHGEIQANRPRSTPPVDAITPWIKGQVVANSPIDMWNLRASVPGSGAAQNTNPNFNPWIGQFYGGAHAYFYDPTSTAQTGYVTDNEVPSFSSYWAINSAGVRDGAIDGNPFRRQMAVATVNQWATNVQNAGLPLEYAALYKDTSLTDKNVFNFYKKLIDGNNKHESRNFEAFNAALSQTFLNNRLGIEAAYDKQNYSDAQNIVYASPVLTVDINTVKPDGTANPGAGEAVIVGRSTQGSGGQDTVHEVKRITVFGELRATDFFEKSLLTRILGRHSFTGLYADDTKDVDGRTWARFATSPSYSEFQGRGYSFDPNREIQVFSYLGAANQITGLSNAKAAHVPVSGGLTVFNSHYNSAVNPADPWINPFNGNASTQSENPANYVGWTTIPGEVLDSTNGDIKKLYLNAQNSRMNVKSEAFIWQGYFWDEVIVPTFGWRKDTAKSWTSVAGQTALGYRDVDDPSYAISGPGTAKVSGQIRSWSVVVHTPKFLRDMLPANTDISLMYNKSSNFQPLAGRVDFLGKGIPMPTGNTRDVGFAINTLNNKLNFRMTWFKGSSKDAPLNLDNTYFLGAMESRAWVAAKKFEAGLTGNPAYSGQSWNYGTNVNGQFTVTAADIAKQQADVTATLAAVDTGLEIWDAWNFHKSDAKWQNSNWDPWSGESGGSPANSTATTDIASKGTEYELSYEPTPSLTITANASHTTAVRTNIGGSINAWIDARNTLWQGPAGDIRMWDGTGSPIRNMWNGTFFNSYKLKALQEGQAVPELRPWHFNLIANYGFKTGAMKGFNVGGAYRWEDKNVIGYAPIKLTIDGTVYETYDVNTPIHGKSQDNVDLWVGYERDITAKVKWRIQLNVKNVLGKNELVPLTINPDGQFALYQIKDGPTWTITNTFKF